MKLNVILVVFFFKSNTLICQIGKIVGIPYTCPMYNLVPQTDTPLITKLCLPFYTDGYYINQKQIAITNQGNVLFYASDTAIYYPNMKSLDKSKKLFYPCTDGGYAMETSALLSFENRKFILIGLDGFWPTYNLKCTHLDASKHNDIKVTSFNSLIQNDTNKIFQISTSRINDTLYLLAVLNYAGKISIFHVGWNWLKKINEYNLLEHVNIYDAITYSVSGRKCQKYVNFIKLSNKGNKLIVGYRENVQDRIRITPTLYTFVTTQIGYQITLFNLDYLHKSVSDSLIILKFAPTTNDRWIDFGNVMFSPNDSLLYLSQQNYPQDGYWMYCSYNINSKPNLIKANCIYKFNDWPKHDVNSMFLTYWGGIIGMETKNSTSNFIYIKNADQNHNENDIKFSTDRPRDYYFLYKPTPFIYNYVTIKTTAINNCASYVKFDNLSHTGRGFTKFTYYIAKDTNGQNWDTIISFDLKYKFTKSGNFAFKCRAENSSDGYSELYEDSVHIASVPKPSITKADVPNIIYASVINNKSIQVVWNKINGAAFYTLFRNGYPIERTNDSFYLEIFNSEIAGPIVYAIIAEDECGNQSSMSNAVKTIFLSAKVIDPLSNADFQKSELKWTNYIGWVGGVKKYQLLTQDQINADYTIGIGVTSDSTFLDNAFIGKGANEKCYKIKAVSQNGILSHSNSVCLLFDPVIYIPNAFTPDGNRLNDTFTIVSRGFIKMNLHIYNAWGQLIFSDLDFKGSWTPSMDIPMGVYAYSLRTKTMNGSNKNYNGTIQLLK